MLQEFSAPHDWAAIHEQTRTTGAVVAKGILPDTLLKQINLEIDTYLAGPKESGMPETGRDSYDSFLGHKTIRLHGLVSKFPAAADIISLPGVVQWATKLLSPHAHQILLNAGELIQIEPGEGRQQAHRDSDSWPLPLMDDPIIVNAIFALDDFTEENGATWVAPDTWHWPKERRAQDADYVRGVMQAGDALLFRGDLIHRGGANDSRVRRRALSISYSVPWVRTVENNFLHVDPQHAKNLCPELQALLGYQAYDGQSEQAGMLGLYENANPARALLS